MRRSAGIAFACCCFCALALQGASAVPVAGRGSSGAVAPVVGSLPALSRPIDLAIVWHQHQPRYLKDSGTGEYLEPWVRIHGIKDYYDMVAILDRYPRLKFTVNLTPVLLAQIDETVAAYDKFVAGGPEMGVRPPAIPGCDRWVRLTLTPPGALTEEEKILLIRNSFRMPKETMIDPYPRFRELAEKRGGEGEEAMKAVAASYSDADWRDLQAWFNLAEFDPDFKEGSVVLPDGDTVSVAGLIAKGRNFSEQDKAEIISDQFKILRNIIPLHKRLQDEGRIELITSPYYHPILPLVCDTDIAAEADHSVNLPSVRFVHPEDAEAQVRMACDAYRGYFGKPTRGMWPSEGSVSDAVVPIVARSGIQWIATDEEVLAKSKGSKLAPEDKYRMYHAGLDTTVGVIFRDHKLSDDIGSVYPKMGGVEAANDLIKKINAIGTSLAGAQGEFVVPIIMDGENAWEQFERDGKDFLNSLYQQIGEASWIQSVTVSEYFDRAGPFPMLGHLAPGSWMAPNFDTWIGEPEEDRAWDYLGVARKAVGAAAGAPGAPGADVEAAMQEIYAAEGSDWFWWFGLDQGSGNDEAFDAAFRATLANAYKLAGLKPPEHLSVPIVSPAAQQPCRPMDARVFPASDGILTEPDEWQHAAQFSDREGSLGRQSLLDGEGGEAGGGTDEGDAGGGQGFGSEGSPGGPGGGSLEGGPGDGREILSGRMDMFTDLYYGYDQENLWLRLDPDVSLEDLAKADCKATIYLSGPNTLAARAFADFSPQDVGHYFGFALSSKIEISLGKDVQATHLIADGFGGWTRDRVLPVRFEKFVEIAIPFALLGLKAGDDLRFGIVGCCQGVQQECVPDAGFLSVTIPPFGHMTDIASIEDPLDDDYGPGTYEYPTNPVFGAGAFDIRLFEMALDPENNLIFRVKIEGNLACPWGSITGYSLQAVDIYIDTDGLPDSGQRSLFAGRNARTIPDHAWEYFVRASMDSVALYDDSGSRLDNASVESYADINTSSIFIKLPRSAITGSQNWHVIAAMLSHDGYSTGGVRPVRALPGEWVFGGCEFDLPCPTIIDLVAGREKGPQEVILSSFRVTHDLAEIPGIEVIAPATP